MADRDSTAVGYRLRTHAAVGPVHVPGRREAGVVRPGGQARTDGQSPRSAARQGQGREHSSLVAAHDQVPAERSRPRNEDGPARGSGLDLSRVMSLLTGRAHTSSAEFWWKFDSHTGRSFAEILHYWADDQGHDVFGLSPQGRDW